MFLCSLLSFILCAARNGMFIFFVLLLYIILIILHGRIIQSGQVSSAIQCSQCQTSTDLETDQKLITHTQPPVQCPLTNDPGHGFQSRIGQTDIGGFFL